MSRVEGGRREANKVKLTKWIGQLIRVDLIDWIGWNAAAGTCKRVSTTVYRLVAAQKESKAEQLKRWSREEEISLSAWWSSAEEDEAEEEDEEEDEAVQSAIVIVATTPSLTLRCKSPHIKRLLKEPDSSIFLLFLAEEVEQLEEVEEKQSSNQFV